MFCRKRPFLWARPVAALIGASLALVIGAGAALAEPEDDLAQVQREIERTEATLESASAEVIAAGQAYQQATAQLPALQQQLDEARGVLAGAQARQVSAARAVEQAQADLVAAGAVVDEKQAALDQARDEIGTFSAQAYEGRDVAELDLLFSMSNPGMLVDGMVYLRYLRREQQRGLDRTSQARTEARDAENVQAGFKRTADLVLAEADTAVAQAGTAEAAAAQAEADLRDTIAAQQQAIAVAQVHQADTEARLADLQSESDKIKADIQARAAQSGPLFGGGKLLMPVKASYKSSDFGMRFDPYYQRWQLHAGVDLAANGGAPIWAAAAGTVIRAGWNGGYGNYTCLYHGTYQGKGFATCYAHQSRIEVAVGQSVSRGQVIGLVGTTGASTGNHLHFEVRLDGTPVDPLPWLPSCLC